MSRVGIEPFQLTLKNPAMGAHVWQSDPVMRKHFGRFHCPRISPDLQKSARVVEAFWRRVSE